MIQILLACTLFFVSPCLAAADEQVAKTTPAVCNKSISVYNLLEKYKYFKNKSWNTIVSEKGARSLVFSADFDFDRLVADFIKDNNNKPISPAEIKWIRDRVVTDAKIEFGISVDGSGLFFQKLSCSGGETSSTKISELPFCAFCTYLVKDSPLASGEIVQMLMPNFSPNSGDCK